MIAEYFRSRVGAIIFLGDKVIMHEIGIVEDLIKLIKEEINKHQNVQHLKNASVSVGRSLAISEESLKFLFESLTKGTFLEGAGLKISMEEGNFITLTSLDIDIKE
ncbi:MAG: hydrogenase/urease maturation nickel metallochaperone HypA [Candidatus Omnitrophica bacterium]|nr:hydrogenase/urease maturation nickel metallochaperone HypA [Candidatus Omnitrophota bacterium]